MSPKASSTLATIVVGNGDYNRLKWRQNHCLWRLIRNETKEMYMRNYKFFIPLLKHIKQYRLMSIELATHRASKFLSRSTMTSNGQVRPIRKFSNRHIIFESNRNGRLEFESNLEVSQVPSYLCVSVLGT